MKKNLLSAAVKGALGLSAAAIMVPGMPAFAQGGAELVEEVEEVVVTGSRIRQAVDDSSRPITVMDRTQIELSGMESVADVLRNTSFNSFGSFRERSGSSFGQVALIALRGLDPDYTAVLINGRRVPGSPLTGGSAVDLNTIPLAAVERIEMLTDSASAVYGADAIGGVVNIIMRDDMEGAEFEIGSDIPSREGADSDHFQFTFGAVGDKGHVTFSGDWFKRDPVFDADRDYSRAFAPLDSDGRVEHADTVGVSDGGNTFFETDFSASTQVGDCEGPGYVKLNNPLNADGGTGCGFEFANFSMQTGGIDRKSTFLDAAYELGDGQELYLENRFTQSETFGRYAPAVGFFGVASDSPFNPTAGTAEERDLFVFHRFVAHGNRNDSVNITELDTVVGFRGTIANTDTNFDVFARQYSYKAREVGQTYVLKSVIEDLVASGQYNLIDPLSQDPEHLAAVGTSSATLQRDLLTDYTQAGVSFDGAAFNLPAGQIGWAAGIETSSTQYKDQYDSFREAVNVLGSAGNSAAGSRSQWAAFGELSIPVMDNMEFGLAARYDDYDDFGSEASPQASWRYQPFEQLTFRASWSEGFKAPALIDLHQEPALSSNRGTDWVRCDVQGLTGTDCPTRQIRNFGGGNPELVAEQSESFNIGFVAEPIAGLRLSVDYFQTDIEDKIDSLTVQQVIDLERIGAPIPDGIVINRADPSNGVPGVIIDMTLPVANITEQTIRGIDLRSNYEFETSIGVFTTSLQVSHLLEFNENGIERIDVDDFHPETNANLGFRWAWNNYAANLNNHYISEHGDGAYDSYLSHDLTLNWAAPWDGEVTVGVRNLTDEDPILKFGVDWDADALELYDVAGRTTFVNYKHTF